MPAAPTRDSETIPEASQHTIIARWWQFHRNMRAPLRGKKKNMEMNGIDEWAKWIALLELAMRKTMRTAKKGEKWKRPWLAINKQRLIVNGEVAESERSQRNETSKMLFMEKMKITWTQSFASTFFSEWTFFARCARRDLQVVTNYPADNFPFAAALLKSRHGWWRHVVVHFLLFRCKLLNVYLLHSSSFNLSHREKPPRSDEIFMTSLCEQSLLVLSSGG